MSWVEKINSNFIIKTGDGKEYRPLWVNAVKTFDFNTTEFEFINQQGALVDRKEPRARRFNLTLYFEGENNLDESEAFEQSSFDKRPWTVTHPYYGQITVQPLGISFDNSKHNLSAITTTVIETLTQDFPTATESTQDRISNEVNQANELLARPLILEPLTAPDIEEIKFQNNNLFNRGKNITTGVEAEEYFNAFNKANNALFVIQNNPIQAIIDLQDFIIAPARFAQSAIVRARLLSRQFNELRSFATRATSRSEKIIYEANAGALLTSHAFALSDPQENEYQTAVQVLDLAETLQSNFDNYISNLDSLQSNNGGELNAYIPTASSLYALNDVINFTVVNLINIALNSRRQRSIILNFDTNIIELTHRLYGLDAQDENIDELIAQNDLSFDELLQINHGREIIYFV